MSLHGLTKNMELEPMIKGMMQAEANGTMMYYALARLAKEQGLDDMAETLIELGNQEAVHAGFYAVLNGKYPNNFWRMLDTLQQGETNAEEKIKDMADKVRAAGFAEAAGEIEEFARQEGHHGVVLAELLRKYRPEEPDLNVSGKMVYICKVCGYEHIGDINNEDDDYICPLCSQPKSEFIMK